MRFLRSQQGPCWPLVVLILWLALLLRLDHLHYTRQNLDRAVPHGLGILIRDAIAEGRLPDLPMLGLQASINLPNPIGASIFYALLSALDADPYSATALNALNNVLVVVVAMSIAQRIGGRIAALGAGLLAATSPWMIWVARGAWLQGTLEGMSALACWLTLNGLVQRRRNHLLAAYVLIAAAMQTYLPAFGLAAQLLSALLTQWRALGTAIRRTVLLGLGVCVLSGMAYFAALRVEGVSLEQTLTNPYAYNEVTASSQVNLDPISHLLRIASGRDFENTFVEPDTWLFSLRDQLSDARAGVIEMLMIFGIAALATRGTSTDRHLLMWSALPTLSALVISNVIMPSWKVHVFYLALTSPAPYVFAGAGLSALKLPQLRVGRATLSMAAATAIVACALVSAWNLQGERETLQRFPLHHDGLHALPLKWQRALANEARRACMVLSNDEPEAWLISLLGISQRVRPATYKQTEQGAAWLVGAQGGACVISTRVDHPPAHAELVWQTSLQGQNRTDRTPAQLALFRMRKPPVSNIEPLAVNLGWIQTALYVTDRVAAGQVLTITQSWQIQALPEEPFWFWYFAPFVKLRNRDDAIVAQLDHLPAFEGWQWRVGDAFYSEAWLALSPDLSPGFYTLELSLFDPNQGKNAVYVKPLAPSQPIVTIRKQLLVEAPMDR